VKPLSDKEYGQFVKMVDEAFRGGTMQHGIITALIIAAGGKVTIGPQQVLDAIEKNGLLRVERVGLDFELRASARPRCEKCGRWERHD